MLFGDVILHLKALSLCFLYTKIKRENKVTEDAGTSQLLNES